MFKITEAIFNEIKLFTTYEIIELYKTGDLQTLSHSFINELGDDTNEYGEPVYFDITEDELIQYLLCGQHRLMKIEHNSLLRDALAFVYGTQNTDEIAKQNGTLITDHLGNFYFFVGPNHSFKEVFKDLGGKQAFLDQLNQNR